MTSFLGCFFLLIFGALFFAFALLRNIFSLFFPHRDTRRTSGSAQSQNTSSTNSGRTSSRGNSRQKRNQQRKKHFAQDEGTYVYYEEVK